MVAEKCCTCKYSFTTGKDRIYCKKSLADKDDCGEYKRISEEGRMANEEIIEQLENAIELIKQDGKDWLDDRDIPILEACIKSLTALDKIREEIKDTLYVDSLIFGELIDFGNGKISADDVIEEFNRVTRNEVLQILDKYKTESEE